jgi:hypothetical protein
MDMKEWIHLYPALRFYARSCGFDQLAFCGRRGWERVLKPYVRTNFTHYTDDLRDA